MTYEFHPQAEQELSDAVHWYEDRSQSLGDRFLLAVAAAIQAILKDPERYQPTDSGIRIFRLDRWPYKISTATIQWEHMSALSA